MKSFYLLFKAQSITRRFTFCILMIGCLIFTGMTPALAAEPVHLEILHMNHGPMRPTIRKLKSLFETYQGKVTASWFDYDQAEGKKFMKEKKLKGHFPMLIYINGKHTAEANGKQINFKGFPSGLGPFKSVEGEWQIDDLQNVLDSLVK